MSTPSTPNPALRLNMAQIAQAFTRFDTNGDNRMNLAEMREAAAKAKEGSTLKTVFTAITQSQETFDEFAKLFNDQKNNVYTVNGATYTQTNQTSGFNVSIADFQSIAERNPTNGLDEISANSFQAFTGILERVKNSVNSAQITVTYNPEAGIQDLLTSSTPSSSTPSTSPSPSTTPSLSRILPFLLLLLSQAGGSGGFFRPGGINGAGGASSLIWLLLLSRLQQQNTSST